MKRGRRRSSRKSKRLFERIGGLRAIHQPAPGALAATTTLVERDVLDLCDGERSVRDVLDVSELGDFETLEAMARLAVGGYLVREGTSERPPAATPQSHNALLTLS